VPEDATLGGLGMLSDALPEASDPAADDFAALVQIS
jgi:hypothetical protein